MNLDDDDFRLGVPGRSAVAAAPPTPAGPRQPDQGPAPELRPGETELGRPPQVAADLAPLSASDRAALKQLDDEQAARDLAEAEML
ncbi:MAG: hypothetical protein K2V38_14370, partial [Gemmataceae bacterium]|nr:hypothetical protein [Gemmataceae bacterium]